MSLKYLTEKKGPLPIWAWAVVTAVVLFGAYLLLRGKLGSSSSTDNNAVPSDAASTQPFSGLGGAGFLDTPNDGPVVTTGSNGAPDNPPSDATDSANHAGSSDPSTIQAFENNQVESKGGKAAQHNNPPKPENHAAPVGKSKATTKSPLAGVKIPSKVSGKATVYRTVTVPKTKGKK